MAQSLADQSGCAEVNNVACASTIGMTNGRRAWLGACNPSHRSKQASAGRWTRCDDRVERCAGEAYASPSSTGFCTA